jgi:TetR/AcrR family transcriptional repressor of nem operon
MLFFWRRGYKATSIDGLVRATEISRGSLYATFHDKRRLFASVLDHYAQKIGGPLLAELNDKIQLAAFRECSRRSSNGIAKMRCPLVV